MILAKKFSLMNFPFPLRLTKLSRRLRALIIPNSDTTFPGPGRAHQLLPRIQRQRHPGPATAETSQDDAGGCTFNFIPRSSFSLQPVPERRTDDRESVYSIYKSCLQQPDAALTTRDYYACRCDLEDLAWHRAIWKLHASGLGAPNPDNLILLQICECTVERF